LAAERRELGLYSGSFVAWQVKPGELSGS